MSVRDGNRKGEIIDSCKEANRLSGPFVLPSMGYEHGSMNLQLFHKLQIYHEYLVSNAMVNCDPGQPMSLTMPESMIEEEDYFAQLLNEKYNHTKGNRHESLKRPCRSTSATASGRLGLPRRLIATGIGHDSRPCVTATWRAGTSGSQSQRRKERSEIEGTTGRPAVCACP